MALFAFYTLIQGHVFWSFRNSLPECLLFNFHVQCDNLKNVCFYPRLWQDIILWFVAVYGTSQGMGDLCHGQVSGVGSTSSKHVYVAQALLEVFREHCDKT